MSNIIENNIKAKIHNISGKLVILDSNLGKKIFAFSKLNINIKNLFNEFDLK